MSGCHGLNAPIQRFGKLIHCAAAFTRFRGYYGYAREHVLDAVVEFGDEQILSLQRLLKSCFTLHEHGLMLASFGKERCKDE
jgi:hypothetical protein